MLGYTVLAQSITDQQLNLVIARLAEGAKQSWELGTRAQALTELNASFYSVFSSTSLPPPTSPPSSVAMKVNLTDVFGIAANTVANLGNGSNSMTPEALISADGAAGDPASLGVAVLLANWTGFQPSRSSTIETFDVSNTTAKNFDDDGQSSTTVSSNSSSSAAPLSTPSTAPTPNANLPLNFAGAARNQLDYLLTVVPRTSDGAISHRVSEVQLWADFIYMAPPFLSYYGVLTNNQSLVSEAYNQVKLYRNYLRDSDANNVWRHITLGTGAADSGHWSTGNGWAAAGTLRVLATIKNSQFANSMKSEQNDLKDWVIEILDGMYGNIAKSLYKPSGLFPNYATDNTTFEDASSTALLAASTYRLAVLEGIYHNLPHAEKSRKTLSTSSHITSEGWLTPVVDPINWTNEGSDSPEGQAFVVEMTAAWKDWVAIGSPGANEALGFYMRDYSSKSLHSGPYLAFTILKFLFASYISVLMHIFFVGSLVLKRDPECHPLKDTQRIDRFMSVLYK
ncbi:hypothetical protein Clacol_008376 [Clathrus columnatus]|uniref:Uncharacterized protein n=1 Tax=Clathrus columnatus TaxID=1419009 RepID=A0AAV5ALW9_9AGAM|nr:hypothetical protein Clacol_008376 [Clathrus columnatus]